MVLRLGCVCSRCGEEARRVQPRPPSPRRRREGRPVPGGAVMTEITIPAEFIGDPVYDSAAETLTFYGSSARLIAEYLSEARIERERLRRKEGLEQMASHFAAQYGHKDTSSSGLL